MAMTEFRDNITMLMPDGQFMPRNTSWTGIRFLLSEVTYFAMHCILICLCIQLLPKSVFLHPKCHFSMVDVRSLLL